jgi:hypothetical protein
MMMLLLSRAIPFRAGPGHKTSKHYQAAGTSKYDPPVLISPVKNERL